MFKGYRDEQLVGEGGLGRLYRAVRESTGGVVAIKSLHDVEAGSPAWHRARRELEALLRLKGHPYVISVEEIIEGPEGPCLVMEYAPGGSLADRLASGPLTVPEFVLVGQHASQALAAAHEQGIVHRDVKPHNLLIAAFGQVKVCDFGISALSRGVDGRTQTHALTLAYASPEELDGDEEVGPPADVYSLGATSMHLLTGVKPKFSHRLGNDDTTPKLQLTGDAEITAAIRSAIRAMLAHAPSDRPTMLELVAIFDRAAVALGADRLSRLPAVTAERPAEPVAVEPVAVEPAADPTVIRPVTAVAADVDLTVVRHSAPASDEPDLTVIGRADPVDEAVQPLSSPRRPRRRVLLATAAAALLGLGGVVAATQGGGESSSSTTDSTVAAVATTTTLLESQPTLTPLELDNIRREYLKARDAMDAAYDSLYTASFEWDTAEYYDSRPQMCAAAISIEFAFIDGVNYANSLNPDAELSDQFYDLAWASGDLINALDVCVKATPGDVTAIDAADAQIVVMNGRSLAAEAVVNGTLGVERGG